MTKELGMETHPGEEVVKEEKFPNNRKPSHRQVHGEFWNLRRQHNWEGKKTPQNRRLTATASEVAQALASVTSEPGLDREVRAASSVLRVRTRPERPEDNLRELM